MGKEMAAKKKLDNLILLFPVSLLILAIIYQLYSLDKVGKMIKLLRLGTVGRISVTVKN